MEKLNPKNPIPLHIQLRDKIEGLIKEGYYQTKIPSERELMEEYDVSRSTVREAVSHLAREGIVEKVHGKGTFISSRAIQDWLSSLTSTTETIRNMGMTPGAKLVDHGTIIPPNDIIAATGLKEAYFIKRIRYANDIPLAIELQYYPMEIGEKLAELDIDEGTLFDLIEKDLGIVFKEAEQLITSGFLAPEDARLLGISETFSVLNTERKLVDQADRLIEYYVASFRADMYSFRIKLSKKSS
ncbi:GntR family transcriptional regulator [Bacillus thermotolerans]|uniref:Transcriptional regulator of N-Acetylglucosamine utilization, GntR family n=1 Tax=Bacillus thermotolerans TaxID=1221996 RepID=A0A0F5I0L7_BACTR|nr:GntR family transcriptional regulator [Bacillus thermotolerans]KKB38845.1 putative transcriptional regulator of N-Acetylglucosamine utilization, GntR family [Bacillus thermotolerans]KKB42486.1 putative transcriptional regulator of N-Acetylglucosamine utilization, GntR family [Bacillus thermotolerans]KKB44566.1 putative transcriptional regulator of N-Acetylglucosamine utilization, GntR family [Bacillus thermotolerans]